MTAPQDFPVSQTGTPLQMPAPRPPFDPWAPPAQQPMAWGPPPPPTHAPQGAADLTYRARGDAPLPHGSLGGALGEGGAQGVIQSLASGPRSPHAAQPDLPGYVNAPAVVLPSAPIPLGHPAALGWTSWDAGRSSGTNGLAVATFVLSWLFWPAAFVTGPIALLSKRRRGQAGRGWAVAGLVLSTFWAVVTVLVASVVVAFLGSGQVAALTGGSPGTATDLEGVGIGQCFLDQGNKKVTVDCGLPHDGEVFFRGAVLGTGTVGYPGELLLQAEAEAMCDAAFATYVGLPYEQSQWHYSSWVPSEDSWLDGDRAATCAVVPFAGNPLTGAVAGTGL